MKECQIKVELSFHAGDIITTYGEMDDDGFYWGELNGNQGLVPSNFLLPMTQSTNQPAKTQPEQPMQQISQPTTTASAGPTPEQPHEQPRTKGVAFQEVTKKVRHKLNTGLNFHCKNKVRMMLRKTIPNHILVIQTAASTLFPFS